MRHTIVLTLQIPKPRNPFAVKAKARRAGRHKTGNERQRGRRDLARRLAEHAAAY